MTLKELNILKDSLLLLLDYLKKAGIPKNEIIQQEWFRDLKEISDRNTDRIIGVKKKKQVDNEKCDYVNCPFFTPGKNCWTASTCGLNPPVLCQEIG